MTKLQRNHRNLRRRRLRVAGAAIFALVSLTACATWYACRRAYTFRESGLQTAHPSRVFTDRDGNVLRVELGGNDQWCIPVPIERVSPHLIQAFVAVEDQRFWNHDGVDRIAVARAALSNVTHGRVVSGASTISMQLARLAHPEARGWLGKLRQTCRALDLESRHTKCWIIEQYVNNAPFGSNIVGAEAAARFYFGKPARDLTLQEATLLAGLPQSPAALRPDRHLAAARRRQAHVLARMAECGYTDGTDVLRSLERGPRLVHRREGEDGRPLNRLGYPVTEQHVCTLAAVESGTARVRTSLDPGFQALVLESLRAKATGLADVSDGAGVVIENATGAVRALVGTLDFHALPAGQVNAACCPRSPGSALKPFIYLLAIEGGLLVPETRLIDRPLMYADYRPGNFDDGYTGELTAAEALARSLNTPAVRLLGHVGVEHFLDHARACGIHTLDRSADEYGLALALGGGEVTLLELTNAYAGIARGGHFSDCHFAATDREARVQASRGDASPPFTHGSVALLTHMLRTFPLPGCPDIPLAWKTGTSNGLRDAWCIAFNSEYTIGVWMGNKTGGSAPELVGIKAAAPVVADIANAIYRDRTPPPVVDLSDGTTPVTICASTGLRAAGACHDTRRALAVSGIALRQCPTHRGGMPARPREIAGTHGATPPSGIDVLSPEPGTYVADGDTVRLKLATVDNVPCAWFIDGQFAGRTRAPVWHHFDRGTHQIACVSDHARTTQSISIDVQ